MITIITIPADGQQDSRTLHATRCTSLIHLRMLQGALLYTDSCDSRPRCVHARMHRAKASHASCTGARPLQSTPRARLARSVSEATSRLRTLPLCGCKCAVDEGDDAPV
jgi:hypothetical protein